VILEELPALEKVPAVPAVVEAASVK